jgi:hypothetical protein
MVNDGLLRASKCVVAKNFAQDGEVGGQVGFDWLIKWVIVPYGRCWFLARVV